MIATKGGFVRGGFEYSALDAVGNPTYLRQCAHMSARRLGVERIDLYYIHYDDKITPPEETLGCFQRLIEAGINDWGGVSPLTPKGSYAGALGMWLPRLA